MSVINQFLITSGKLASKTVKSLNLGHGSTWPGHIALSVNKNFVRDIFSSSRTQIVIVAGTNGKTTTSKMIQTILKDGGKTLIQNHSGANLLNGIASSLILASSPFGRLDKDFAILEVDENALPQVLKEVTPDYLILLNLFSDQLDRYGEVNSIAKKWKKAIDSLPPSATLLLNADDPEIAYLGEGVKAKKLYFGLSETTQSKTKHEHAVDSTYCPRCGSKLHYKKIFFSHLGEWKCSKCGLTQPHRTISDYTTFPLLGMYNQYNTLAAVLLARTIQIDDTDIKNALKNFAPAFGRQERIVLNNKNIQIFLVKNPTGFNEALRTIAKAGAKTVLLPLNDRIADGTDVSWIWDVDMEDFVSDFNNIIVSGTRVFDMGLRIKYAIIKQKEQGINYIVEEDLKNAINVALSKTPQSETLYILPTYTAMLDVRKIITGKKIL